jgi:hypothetical protein
LIFPIFVGHWTLLIVNFRECAVNYLNPIKKSDKIQDYLISLFIFLRNELQFHENRDITLTRWKDLSYQKVNEIGTYLSVDSAVYICKHAEFFATGKKGSIDSARMSEYRREMLFNILTRSGELRSD